MKLKFLPILIVLILWIVGISYDYYLSMKQRNISVNFIISKVERTATSQLSLYNDENKVDLRNFTFMHYYDIKTGDSVIKKEKDDLLFFYRKNSETMKFEKNLVLYPEYYDSTNSKK